MLLQIEILLRITSVLIIIATPIVYLWRRWKGRSTDKFQQLSQDGADMLEDVSEDIVDKSEDAIDLTTQEDVIETNHDFSADDALIQDQQEEEHYDPVIAAMRQEEANIEDASEDASEDIADIGGIMIEEIIEEDASEDLYSAQEQGIGEQDASEDDAPMIIEKTIEMIDIDLDGDGTIDETIIVQTTSSVPTDLAETKRQKSLEMIQFELRNLKDKGQTSSYEKKLIEARALHPDRNDFTMMLADHYYDQGEQKKALGLYRALVSADSTDDKSLSMVANCYIKLGEWENAQVILEKLVQDKPENPRYRMSLAEVYYNNKETDKTIDCVRTMVKLRPTNADYLSTLAQLYHESAYYDLYVQILYRMLELDPLNHEIKAEIEKYS